MATDAEGPNFAAEQGLREAREEKWAEYQQAVSADEGEARRQFEEALRQFRDCILPGS